MCHRPLFLSGFRLLILHNFLQTEIVKRMSAIIGQVLPFLSQEHQQQVATAVERAKQVTMSDLNTVVGVSFSYVYFYLIV